MRLSRKVEVVCTKCGHRFTIRELIGTVSIVGCPKCGGRVEPGNASTAVIKGRTDSQKRSRRQEKKAAERYGGRAQPGSGSIDTVKSDVRDAGVSRGECKLTRAKSYSLKLELLNKIEAEAVGEELPYMEIEFQGVNPHRRFVVMPAWAFETLLERSRSGNTDD